jgi:hypothetical protein
MIEFIGTLYNLLQHFANYYLRLDTLDFWPHYSSNWTVSQSQSYSTTGGLPPISSSWRQAPWDPRPDFFFQLNSCGNSPYVASSLTRRWVVSHEYAWYFVKCTFHTCSMLLNISSFYATHKSSVSTGFTEQIKPILRILCYNGSLVTWTVVGLTTAKFKLLIFYELSVIVGFPLYSFGSNYTENTSIA